MFSRFTSLHIYSFLLILVFIAGFEVMALEFAGSRLLTPVFGDSIYTWGSLIGVILLGLSGGYLTGGRLADRNSNFEKFCSILFSSGIYIFFIPFISSSIIDFSSSVNFNSISDNNRDIGIQSLLATFLLLAFPTFLLGMISPYATKLATKTLEHLGNISGNIYFLSTLGSILGTFLTVFLLIPTFQINNIIHGLGILLISSSLFGLKSISKVFILSIIAILLFSLTSTSILPSMHLNLENLHFHQGNLLYETETLYSHLDVIDNYLSPNNRALFLNGYLHSLMDKTDPVKLVVDYTKYFPLGLEFNSDIEKVLFIGGGGFSGPKFFLKNYQNMSVDVVEIDPKVVEVATEFFYLDRTNPKLKVFTQDARKFLTSSPGDYDLIVLDAFSKSYVPFHLMTQEFYQILFNKLSGNGIIISNHIGSPNSKLETSDLYRANYKTMLEVFPHVYVFATEKSKDIQNIILVAVKNTNQLQTNDIDNFIKDEIFNGIGEKDQSDLVDYGDYFIDSSRIEIGDVPLLTDQYAPVENLLNPLSSRPYSIEEQEQKPLVNSASSSSDIDNSVTTTFPFMYLLFFVVLIVWMILIKTVWKITIRQIRT